MVLVFDIGATKTRLALGHEGELGEVVRFATDRTSKGFEKFLEAARVLIAGHKLTAVAGGLPGQIDPASGVLTRVMNMPAWNSLKVRAMMEELVTCPVYLTNDVVLVGLGEAEAQPEKNRGVMMYFTISSGVNAVRLVDGKVDTSIKLFDVGQQLMADGEGRVVTLESLTGGAAFAEHRLRVASGVRDGRTWRAVEHYLARGLYNTILHWTPDVMMFGGSMMRDIDLVAVAEELEELRPELPYMPDFAEGRLGDEGGLRGGLVWLQAQGLV